MSSHPETIKEAINKRFDKLYHICRDGNRIPFVCIVCDKLMKPEDVQVLKSSVLEEKGSILVPSVWNSVSPSLANCYHYRGEGYVAAEHIWMDEMLLSPRACFIDPLDGRMNSGFSCCSKCKRSLEHSHMPQYAIANNFAVGTAPPCLTDLTEVELALLTPVKTYIKHLPIYNDNCPEFKDWLNCFMVLEGMHRFSEDPEWGKLLLRFRNGRVTVEDIDKINERLVMWHTELPENIKYATFTNRDRDDAPFCCFHVFDVCTAYIRQKVHTHGGDFLIFWSRKENESHHDDGYNKT